MGPIKNGHAIRVSKVARWKFIQDYGLPAWNELEREQKCKRKATSAKRNAWTSALEAAWASALKDAPEKEASALKAARAEQHRKQEAIALKAVREQQRKQEASALKAARQQQRKQEASALKAVREQQRKQEKQEASALKAARQQQRKQEASALKAVREQQRKQEKQEASALKAVREQQILNSHTAPAGESELLSTEVDHIWLGRFPSLPPLLTSDLEQVSSLWIASTRERLPGFEHAAQLCYTHGLKPNDIVHAILIKNHSWVYKFASELRCLSKHRLYSDIMRRVLYDVRVPDRLFQIQRDNDRYLPTLDECVKGCSSFLAKIGDSNPMENAKYAMQCWSINNYHYLVDRNDEVDLFEKYGKTPM